VPIGQRGGCHNHKIPIEDQNIVLALIRDFNIASINGSFKFVFKVPIDIINGKTRIGDENFTNIDVKTGINIITSILSQEDDDIKGNISETSGFKKKIKITNDKQSFYIFSPHKQMFLEDLHSARYYMFHDILCNQYFQEYSENIHIEHLLINSKLAYLCDYAVTTNSDDEFELVLKILEFALVSSFAQCRVTETCNTSAGSKPRWKNTIDQYINILEFVCKLYYCPNNTSMAHNGSESTTTEYIKKMKENSNIILNSNRKDEGFKTNYIKKPTIIMPQTKLGQKLEGKDPKIDYDFDLSVRTIEEIGKSANTLGSDIINCFFNNPSRVIAYNQLRDLITERVKNMNEYESIAKREIFKFGSENEEKELLGQLPPIGTMISRIKKIENLIESNKPESMFDQIIESKQNTQLKLSENTIKRGIEQKRSIKKSFWNRKIIPS
jgi:hypothetical protein